MKSDHAQPATAPQMDFLWCTLNGQAAADEIERLQEEISSLRADLDNFKRIAEEERRNAYHDGLSDGRS